MSVDILKKCYDFATDPRVVRPEEIEMAARLLSDVSAPGNAGPWFQTDNGTYMQFSSNDYLGIAAHPDIQAKALAVVEKYGIYAPMGSRSMTGTTSRHLELERRVAEFKGSEAAIVFTTGSLAMIGMVAALATPRDVLFLDQCAHASLVCGARMSGATTVFFRHNDLDHLQHLLAEHADGRGAAIVVDGVYSMQGDLAPLTELVELKNQYGIPLIVDDAHGTGVFGPHGRGTAADQGLTEEVDIHAGTFSKAVGTIGGFVAGDEALATFLRFNAPTYLFTKAMPLAVVEATLVALDLVEQADEQRERLWRNARRLQNGLIDIGMDIGNTASPITPIQFEGTEALDYANELRQTHGIWAAPVLYPAVELGTSILRVIPTAAHKSDDIDDLLECIASI